LIIVGINWGAPSFNLIYIWYLVFRQKKRLIWDLWLPLAATTPRPSRPSTIQSLEGGPQFISLSVEQHEQYKIFCGILDNLGAGLPHHIVLQSYLAFLSRPPSVSLEVDMHKLFPRGVSWGTINSPSFR
jgi:hypothetical protein